MERGAPDYIRSDKGARFTAEAVRERLARIVVKTLFVELGKPWANGHNESFNGKPRDEALKAEILDSLRGVRVIIERSQRHHNTVRPHNALGHSPSVPKTIIPGWPDPAFAIEGLRRDPPVISMTIGLSKELVTKLAQVAGLTASFLDRLGSSLRDGYCRRNW